MFNDFKLTKEYVQFKEGFNNWEEAIKIAAQPLLQGGEIQPSYVDSMIESVKEYGPYIIIAPNIALPHARPESGSKKIGFSVMLTKEPVKFDEENQASLFITLSCVDSETHLIVLQKIVEILSNIETHDRIFSATTKEEILEIFS